MAVLPSVRPRGRKLVGRPIVNERHPEAPGLIHCVPITETGAPRNYGQTTKVTLTPTGSPGFDTNSFGIGRSYAGGSYDTLTNGGLDFGIPIAANGWPAFSIAVWWTVASLATKQSILSIASTPGASQPALLLDLNNNIANKLDYLIGDVAYKNGSLAPLSPGLNCSIIVWAGSATNSGTLTCYLNGLVDFSGTNTISANITRDNVYLGTSANGSMTGSIFGYQAWTRALSAAEAMSVYTNPFASLQSPMDRERSTLVGTAVAPPASKYLVKPIFTLPGGLIVPIGAGAYAARAIRRNAALTRRRALNFLEWNSEKE